MIHYIYRIDFLCGEPGRYYLGKRSYRGRKIENDTYAGSGKFCFEYYNEFGQIRNITYVKTIIEINNTFEENLKREEIVIGDLWKTDPLCMNLCPGGWKSSYVNNKKVVQYDLEGNVIHTYDSIAEANEKMGSNKICACCQGDPHYKTIKGFIWRYDGDAFDKYYTPKHSYENPDLWVPINQYTIEGHFIKTWRNTIDAAEVFSNTKDASTIFKCIHHIGNSKSAHGYRWELYTGLTEDLPEISIKQVYPIRKYDLNNNFIEEYKSCKKAAEALGSRHTEGIIRCAKGLQESSLGYKWKFVE